MLTMLIFAHLLGDYLFQFDFIARWKSRSLWGVAAHGGIVTLTTLACAALVDPGWLLYAALIGVTHGLIDIVKARLLRPQNATWDMVYYLLDQVVHFAVITLVATLRPANGIGARVVAPQVLAFATGYLLLLQPAWVLLRFIVRGVWGAEAAPHLGIGEKYEPMIERVLIASFVLAGQVALVPLALLPRRLTTIRVQDNGVGVLMQLTGHWAETLLSVLLAAGVGLILRVVMQGR